MKRLFLRLFMLISTTAFLAACGQSPHANDVSGTVQTRIPVPQSDGSYVMQIVELTGLDSLYELSGQFVRFFMSPSIENGHLTGSAPKARFVKSGGLYVAADELSLQLATVYTHMAKLAALDHELGVGDLNHWPRDIGVGVRLSGGMLNNAFYDGETDSMLFVPYLGKDLPLAVNAGILAHEHFHSLFYKIVTVPLNQAGKNPGRVSLTAHAPQGLYEAMPKIRGGKVIDDDDTSMQSSYHIMLIRGLNEGIADFWGWLYTGDPDFIAYSLPTQKNERTLKTRGFEDAMILSSGADLRRAVSVLSDQKNLANNLVNYAYTIGTQYSRIFKTFADTYAQDRQMDTLSARKEVAKLILKTLPTLREDILKLKATDYYEPSRFLLSFLGNVENVKEDECNIFAEVMNKNDMDGNFTYSCEESGGSAGWSLIKKELYKDNAKASSQGVIPPPKVPVVFR